MIGLKNYITAQAMQKAENAVDNVLQQIDDEINIKMREYYADYTPKQYVRVYYMLESPTTINARQLSDDTVVGEEYIRNSAYDLVPQWSVFDSVEEADNYTHGGYRRGAGVSVWEEPIDRLSADVGVWAKALRDAGFNI